MKGICFKSPLFHLTVQGTKKQTRRIIKPQPDKLRSINRIFCNTIPSYELTKKPWEPEPSYHFFMHEGKYLKPRYKVDEIVYLKEPYHVFDEENNLCLYKYPPKEDWLTDKEFSDIVHSLSELKGWHNKLFMPEKYARYFIKITNVRAERLQDISEEDCIKEGIKVGRCGNESKWMKAFYVEGDNQPYITARRAYEMLINKINGKDTWQSNPWVWVYEYELIKQ